jgi:hypothetical protein
MASPTGVALVATPGTLLQPQGDARIVIKSGKTRSVLSPQADVQRGARIWIGMKVSMRSSTDLKLKLKSAGFRKKTDRKASHFLERLGQTVFEMWQRSPVIS